MPWDQSTPWTAPARELVLYQDEQGWRFAVSNNVGILDGRLHDLSTDALDDAKAELLDLVENATGLTYRAEWRSERPGWWTADLGPST